MQAIFNCINRQIFLFLMLMSLATTGWSLEASSPYILEFPLSEASKEYDQEKLSEQAFQTFLTQLSGSDKILQIPMVSEALKEPDKYITQFSYHQRSTDERYIKVVFNENKINQLFAIIRQPIWGKDRPLTVLWLVIERNEGPGWIGGEAETALTQEMANALSSRAIPFVFPLLDLTDTSKVTEREIANQSLEPIRQAAKRYNANAILVGRLFEKEGGWQGQWTLIKEQETTTWNTTEQEPQALVKVAAENLAAKLMENNTTVASRESPAKNYETLKLVISGIKNMQKYNQVREYLRSLPGITAVDVLEVMPESTTFQLETKLSKESISNAIAQDRLLITNSLVENLNEKTLLYQVTGG